ncbi:MAG: FixH family protein [Polyangiaceae bacterium]|nr:FixH family protein [Polyangiaceae bacterium]MCW5791187.1 FixH family protein [Polyangiaceae bacterium]
MSQRTLAARSSSWLIAPLVLSLLGCGSDDAGDEPGPDAQGFACAQQTDSYHAGLSKLGAASRFRVTLLDADPAPPARYDNRWTLAVEDAASSPVLGATLRVNPDMPEHGHGVLRPVIVAELGDGRYQLDDVYLHMPGYWEIPIEVRSGDTVDEVRFAFCILP